MTHLSVAITRISRSTTQTVRDSWQLESTIDLMFWDERDVIYAQFVVNRKAGEIAFEVIHFND